MTRHNGEERLIEAAVRLILRRSGEQRPASRRVLDNVATFLGVTVEHRDFNGRVRAVIFEDRIYVAGEPAAEAQLWAYAHTLAHLLAHVGDRRPFVCADLDSEAEQQADTFARFLLTAGD